MEIDEFHMLAPVLEIEFLQTEKYYTTPGAILHGLF